ncbi:phage tail protein [Bradyrhizobium yuanmingense]|uniref:phage tail protein n=1 Tax=Bradyrhizobium yuanmingense TaxID=108015 RepID=UPI0004B4541C|nr:phage tail protein [Bradyrhizobium yuanmingense]
MATYKTILTNKGLQLVASASAAGTQIVLTDMAVGDGNGNPVTPNPAQTTLARERYRYVVNRLVAMPDDPTAFLAELIIPADVGGFTIREVGLYTNNGELFAVANVPNAYKPTADEGSFGDTVVRMVFKVANASVVTIVFDPNVTVATQSWVTNNVNAASLIPGGLTNQFLAKNTNANGDFKWVDPTEGITVIVFSREETQTLAAGQKVIDLAEITAEGAAVYIEGTRLRADEFSQTDVAQITLASSHPDGTKVTVVQNEEVGSTDVLLRPLNLSDVPDKNAARLNLGLPNWLATSNINWSQLLNVPDYAKRWASWSEVTDKPTTFAPSAHTHPWAQINGAPETATRWPSWTEVTSKPSLYPPSAHSHAEYVMKTGGEMTGTLHWNFGADILRVINNGVGSASLQAVNQAQNAFAKMNLRGDSLEGTFAGDVKFNATQLAVVGPLVPGGQYAGYILQQLLANPGANGDLLQTQYYRTTNDSSTSWSSFNWRFGRQVDASVISYIEFQNSQNVLLVTGMGAGQFTFANNGSFSCNGGYDFGSSRKLKDIDGPVPYGLTAVERMELAAGHYKPEYNADGRRRLFFVAEQLAELVPEAVDLEGVEFNGERVPSIKLDQLLPVMAKAIQELAAEVRALKAGR